MRQGKHICETLKGIRKEIAQANDIDYKPIECSHNGDCAGTCPACESEMRWLERQLRLRQSLGKAVIVAGLSLTLSGVATASPSPVPSDRKKNVKQHRTHKQKKINNDVFPVVGSVAEGMPSFPGGDVALMKFIKDNMIYPYEALKNRIEGKVIIQFVVTKTGKVGKVKVVRSVNKELDQEAVRLIKMLPDFSPGRNNVGEPVNVWYILPVIFKLPDNN